MLGFNYLVFHSTCCCRRAWFHNIREKKFVKNPQNHKKSSFFATLFEVQMGVTKTKKNLLFSIPGSSWFIYTPTQKSNSPIQINRKYHKPSKIKHFTHFHTKKSISHPISSNPTKINTSTITQPKSQPTIQTTFFLYKYKNPKKIATFTDYKFSLKPTPKITTPLTTHLIAPNFNFNLIPYQDIQKHISHT